jgi:hypothetical protein
MMVCCRTYLLGCPSKILHEETHDSITRLVSHEYHRTSGITRLVVARGANESTCRTSARCLEVWTTSRSRRATTSPRPVLFPPPLPATCSFPAFLPCVCPACLFVSLACARPACLSSLRVSFLRVCLLAFLLDRRVHASVRASVRVLSPVICVRLAPCPSCLSSGLLARCMWLVCVCLCACVCHYEGRAWWGFVSSPCL